MQAEDGEEPIPSPGAASRRNAFLAPSPSLFRLCRHHPAEVGVGGTALAASARRATGEPSTPISPQDGATKEPQETRSGGEGGHRGELAPFAPRGGEPAPPATTAEWPIEESGAKSDYAEGQPQGRVRHAKSSLGAPGVAKERPAPWPAATVAFRTGQNGTELNRPEKNKHGTTRDTPHTQT